MADLLQRKGVHLFSTEDPVTKHVWPRLIRTLKRKLYSYFHAKKTNKWIDVLQDIVDGYNDRVHSVIKMAPNQVNKENQHIVSQNNYYNRGKEGTKERPGGTSNLVTL